MALCTRAARRCRWSGWLVVLLAFAVAGCGAENFPQSTLYPNGDFAEMVNELFMTTFWWAAAIFVLVEGALVYVIVRYRAKPGDTEPKQVHGNTVLEIVWTAIPALILAIIAVPTIRTIFKTYEVPGDNPLEVEVIGHQWWWEFKYPQYGVTTANELHVPVGRTVSLKISSSDVLHSFWIAPLAGKRDAFPNRPTVLWFKAEEAGFYPGQCAEFCGVQHGEMAFHVLAEDPGDFETYIQDLKTPSPLANLTSSQGATAAQAAGDTAGPAPEAAPVDSLVAQGRELFRMKGCFGCHSVDATNAPAGLIGPNLSNVGARRYIASGTLLNTDENLAAWIRDPQQFKEGVKMPTLGVTAAESEALVAYLRALAQQ